MQYFKVHFIYVNVYADGKAKHFNTQNVILYNLLFFIKVHKYILSGLCNMMAVSMFV